MNIKELLSELLQFSKEREWFEFKENWFEPIALGEYVSALSNATALVGKEFAYFVWGVYKDYKKAVESFKVAAEHGVNQAIGALIRAVKEYKDHQPTA